jgi:AcrR family transcriptional regulator
LRSEDRRNVLLDAAASILADHGLDAVTMDAVAAYAGVSRPLVYKHFTNRDELLAAVLRREATELDAAIVNAVEQVDGFESKIRVMIHEVLDAVGTHGAIFQPLLRTGSRDSAYRQEQRARDRRTVRFFARLAQAELDLDLTQATAAMGVLLSGVESVRAQYRTRPTAEHRKLLEDLYVDLVIGGLTRLKEQSPPPTPTVATHHAPAARP